MMGLTPAQLMHIGFQFILDSMAPSSAYGRAALSALKPFKQAEERARELDNLEKLLELRREHQEFVRRLEHLMMGTKDIRVSLELCAQGKVLTDIELFEIKSFLLQLEDIILLFNRLNEFAGLTSLGFQTSGGALTLLDPEENRVASFYLSERYSEKLAGIRQKKRAAELEIRRCEDVEEKERLMSQRQKLVALEQAEEARIRAALSRKLTPYVPSLLHNCNTIARLDLLVQKVALVQRFGGAKPQLGADAIVLTKMRNPMLATALEGEGKTYTPVSITLQEGATVITGANMGGKSVVLKTLALNILLCHCGFYSFSEAAQMPAFDSIYLVSEDLEAASRGLSSFGGEIVRLKEVTERLQSEFSIVLLDEFARGTNPDEGAAIAWALTRWLDSQRTFAVLTTHFEHVAEAAGAHWRVAGMTGIDWNKLKREIETQALADGISLIARHMNYGLLQISEQEKIPHDAIEICGLLGFSNDIIDAAKKKLLTFGKK